MVVTVDKRSDANAKIRLEAWYDAKTRIYAVPAIFHKLYTIEV